MITTLRATLCVVLLSSATAAAACSSCGCTLTSDWISQGLTGQPGTRIDLRYDYIPQTDLRSGTGRVGPVALPADREIERHTDNHYVTLGIDHSWSPDWGVNVQLPLNMRPHLTVAEGDVDASHSLTQGLGDARITVRYQGFGGGGITGVTLGLKLPTGDFRTRFNAGSQTGELLDRGLQNGSGTTDAIVGAYHFGSLASRLDYFIQAQADVPLDGRAQFRPGITGTASAGLDYTRWAAVTPQLQLYVRVAGLDSGAQSDRDNSGGELVYISPGVSVRLAQRLTGFGFVQLPLYERVHGFQLTPRATLSLGLRYRI